MGVLLWTKCLHALQRKEDLSNTSSWRVGVVFVPHPHFTCWCFCKVLQTLIFYMQNPVAPPLSVWETECGSCLVLGTDADTFILFSKGIVHAAVHSKLLHTHLAIADCALHLVWGSLVQQDHCPGLQQQWGCEEAASSTGCPGHCPVCVQLTWLSSCTVS